MRKLHSREIFFAGLAALALAVFGIRQLALKPLQEKQARIEARMRSDQARLNKAAKVLGLEQAVEGRYQKLAQAIGRAGPAQEEQARIMAAMNAAAGRAGIRLSNLTPQSGPGQKNAVFFQVQAQIDGTWPGIVQFLLALQRGDEHMFISALDMDSAGQGGGRVSGHVVASLMRIRGQRPNS